MQHRIEAVQIDATESSGSDLGVAGTTARQRRPLRICMIGYAFYVDDTRIRQYASALIGRGYQVDFIGLKRGLEPSFEVVSGVRVFNIQRRTRNERGLFHYLFRILRFFFGAMALVTKLHLQSRYDVVHVHSVPDFLVFTAIVPKLTGARVILDIHDILPEFYASKFNISENSLLFRAMLLIERFSVAFATHVIVANHLWSERIGRRNHCAEKCTTIRNHPDPHTFHPEPRQRSDGKFVILYPGSLNRHQGLDVAIRAFARIADSLPSAQFHIYGEGPAKASLIQLAKELKIESQVLFHEFLPVTDIAHVMAQADLAVVPKRASNQFGNEAASTKIEEFMSVGVPVIVTRTKIDSFYFSDSLVKFFASDDDRDLAECMLLMARKPELRAQYSENARKYAEQNNWGVRKGDYLNLVDALVPARA